MKSRRFYRLVLSLFLALPVALFFVDHAAAASLTAISNRISTSRPSASAPITANQAAAASQVTIFDNGSVFLASDSATLRLDTGETQNIVTVASMSAADTPAAGQRIVFFNGTAANTHHAGDPIVTPITAIHNIQFTVSNAVPVSGKIVLTFPALGTGDANVAASPSATTFQLNNIVSGTGGRDVIDVYDDASEISANLTMAGTNPSGAGTSPVITLTLDGSTSIAAGSVIKIFLGCTTSSSASCSVTAPRVINPTTNSITAGTGRQWNLGIQTQDTNSVVIDSASTRIATIDSVLVQATVDPSLTVTIAGLANNANFNGTSGCASEVTNSGIAATATGVNLGNLGNGVINKAGQTITVTTNASYGYSIVATSSGRLIDPSTGHWITDANGGDGLTANDTPAPAAFPSTGNPAFGIAPCGTRVPTASPDWDDESALAFGSGGKASNPWNSGTGAFYATVASYTGGPVSGDATAIRYAATIGALTPAGTYRTVFTYVVTPTF